MSGPPLSFFVNNLRSYYNRYTVLGVDWPFASLLRRGLLCHREAGKKKMGSAQGTMGKGKKEERRLFPLPIVPRALGIFRLLLFLLGYPAGASAEESDLLLPFNPRRGRNTIAVLIFLINSIGLSKL